MPWNTQTILLIFVAFTGLAVLLQAIVMLAIFFALRKTAKQILDVTNELRSTLVPVALATQQLIERVGPQLIGVTASLVELTNDWRSQAAELRQLSAEVKSRFQRQAARIDALLSSLLDRIERLANCVDSAVSTPVRQANAAVQAFKAAIDRYFRHAQPPASHAPSDSARTDNDLFV